MIEKYLEYLRWELNRAELTVEAYSKDIRQFQEWISPKDPDATDFTTVTTNDVRAWLATRAKGGDTPRTLRRKIISLRMLFKWMIKKEMIKVSPVRDLPLPKIAKPLPDLVKPSEIEDCLSEFLHNTNNDELKSFLKYIVVGMLYSLGLRRAELVNINDSDISFSSGELKVTGKRSKQRVVPVPNKLLDQIKKWQDIRDKNSQATAGDSPLFSINGKRLATHQIYYIVNQALKLSSARKKSPHALRHSFASVMLNGGAEIDSVREFLGHASLATTQIYTHVSFKEIRDAYVNAHPRSLDH